MQLYTKRFHFLRHHFVQQPQENEVSTPELLSTFGRSSSALLYSALFMPDLIEIDGSILIFWKAWTQELREEFSTVRAKKSSSRDVEELESNYNWIEIGDLFEEYDSSDEEDEVLAELVAKSWRSHLKSCYPERVFQVDVLPPEVTGGTVGVQFFEKRTRMQRDSR